MRKIFPLKRPRGPRKGSGLIDRLSNSKNRINFINSLGNKGRKALMGQQKDTCWEERKNMLHAPVICQNNDADKLCIAPLNDLLDGETD